MYRVDDNWFKPLLSNYHIFLMHSSLHLSKISKLQMQLLDVLILPYDNTEWCDDYSTHVEYGNSLNIKYNNFFLLQQTDWNFMTSPPPGGRRALTLKLTTKDCCLKAWRWFDLIENVAVIVVEFSVWVLNCWRLLHQHFSECCWDWVWQVAEKNNFVARRTSSKWRVRMLKPQLEVMSSKLYHWRMWRIQRQVRMSMRIQTMWNWVACSTWLWDSTNTIDLVESRRFLGVHWKLGCKLLILL